uniref:Large ribosomal subunit protein uL24m n=1 Tax=Panagrellus redivivus TaxID=6233 RepID=A0A7E4VS08_PANRE
MNFSRLSLVPRRVYAELDYARHMPQSYVNRMKRTVPRKVYDNRFGAPKIVRYYVHPDDYVPNPEGRPWEQKPLQDAVSRENTYHSHLLHNKFHDFEHKRIKPIPAEKWTIFPGDTVQIMVGKDKNKQGVVARVLRETNSIFVDGLHTKLEKENAELKTYGIPPSYRWVECRLDPLKNEVQLVDPNDKEPCTASWILNEAKTEWIRVSDRTGYEIPMPNQAYVTYEYVSPSDYIEVEGKDTTSLQVLKRTYTPKLSLVEDQLAEELGIKEDRVPRPTYWY